MEETLQPSYTNLPEHPETVEFPVLTRNGTMMRLVQWWNRGSQTACSSQPRRVAALQLGYIAASQPARKHFEQAARNDREYWNQDAPRLR
jgi:hypothetical protein